MRGAAIFVTVPAEPEPGTAKIVSPVQGHSVSQVSVLRDGGLVISSWNPEGQVVLTDADGTVREILGGADAAEAAA